MEVSSTFNYQCLEIIDSCVRIRDLKGVKDLIAVLQTQIGIYGCIVGCKEKFDRCLVEESFITSFGISPEWLEIYKTEKLDAYDPVAHRAFQTEAPVVWSEIYQSAAESAKDFISLSQDFRLLEGTSCATQSNRFNGFASCVSAIFDHTSVATDQMLLLQRILPHLNEAIAQPSLTMADSFTHREIEILQWVQAGKSSWEIGIILAISERTVKFHLSNIYRKLDVHSRAQAVARAMRLGIM